MNQSDLIALITAVGILYIAAEEEAARLRRQSHQRRARMRRRRERRRTLLASFAAFDQDPFRRYAQPNHSVPILSCFFSGADTTPAFRLSRDSLNRLLRMLPTEQTHGWGAVMEMLVTVYWLACGASYRMAGDVFSIPLATVCRMVHSTIDKMMDILHKVVHFPKEEEMVEVGAGFARLAGHEAFCCAAGATDGCHIRIRPPGEPQKQSYINRKLFPSIILQGICDSRGAFLDVYSGNTGSVHDALVLRRSPMYQQALYPPAGYFLLADGGYPCLQYPVAIVTLYRQPVESEIEARFSRLHARARNVIERCFGLLKTRWRAIFLRALEIQPQFAPKVVGACCILHNICMAAGDILEEEQLEEDSPDLEGIEFPEPVGRHLSGNVLRGRLAAQTSAPDVLPPCLEQHDCL